MAGSFNALQNKDNTKMLGQAWSNTLILARRRRSMSSTIPYGPSYTFPSVIPHKRWNPWSESDRALVVQMDADGVPHSEIEKLFHVKKGHITKSLNTWGVARKNRCIPFSDDEIVLIKEAYYRSGLFQVDLSVLSATLGRGRTTVCYMAGKLGLTNIGKRKLPSNKRDIAQRNKWITNAHPRGMLGKSTQTRIRLFLLKMPSSYILG